MSKNKLSQAQLDEVRETLEYADAFDVNTELLLAVFSESHDDDDDDVIELCDEINEKIKALTLSEQLELALVDCTNSYTSEVDFESVDILKTIENREDENFQMWLMQVDVQLGYQFNKPIFEKALKQYTNFYE